MVNPKVVKLKKDWTKYLSCEGWQAYFKCPKKFMPGDKVLVAYSDRYGMQDIIHTIVKAFTTVPYFGGKETVYEVKRPNGGVLYVSSTYLIKPRRLKWIITHYNLSVEC